MKEKKKYKDSTFSEILIKYKNNDGKNKFTSRYIRMLHTEGFNRRYPQSGLNSIKLIAGRRPLSASWLQASTIKKTIQKKNARETFRMVRKDGARGVFRLIPGAFFSPRDIPAACLTFLPISTYSY